MPFEDVSSLLDSKYLFCRLIFFAAYYMIRLSYLDYFKIRLDVCSDILLFHEICAWNIMQVSAYLCKVKWIFIQNIMVNRKLWNFYKFSAPLRKCPIFLLFVFSLFLLFWINYRKQKQKRKIQIFAVFAWKRPFLSQIKRLFSVIYAYIGQTTPHTPTFGTRRVGQLSSENFLFFLFFYFL